MEVFKLVEGYPELGVFADGLVVNIKARRHVDVHLSGNGYLYTQTYSELAKGTVSLGIHQAVCIAHYGPPMEGQIPNHLDGNKLNNHPSNLAWSTYSQNISHAYMSGLRTDNSPMSAMDIVSGEIISFHSIGECARYFGTAAPTIWRNLRSNNDIHFGRFVLRLDSDPRPWPNYRATDAYQRVNGKSVGIRLTCARTGEVLQFGSTNEAGRFLSVSASTVTNNIDKSAIAPYKGYHIQRLTSPAQR